MTVLFPLIGLIGLFLVLKNLLGKTDEKLKLFFYPVLGFKIIVGMSFGLIYTFYYQLGDSLFQYGLATDLYAIFERSFSEFITILFQQKSQFINTDPRSIFFIKILSVINLFAFNNYWITTLVFSVISFVVVWLLILRIIKNFEVKVPLILLSFLLFPSVAFWTSGIVKESISYSAMCLIFWVTIPIYKSHQFRLLELLVGILAMIFLWWLKYYHAAVLILFLIPLLFLTVLKKAGLRGVISGLIVTLTFILTLVGLSFSHYNFNLFRVMNVIVLNNADLISKSKEGSYFTFAEFVPTVWSFVSNWPMAIYYGLFGPLPWDSWNLISFIASLENLMLLVLSLLGLYFGRLWQSKDRILLLWGCGYVFSMASLLAFSTPNFGTLGRYNVAYLPIFLTLLFHVIPFDRFNKKIRPSA